MNTIIFNYGKVLTFCFVAWFVASCTQPTSQATITDSTKVTTTNNTTEFYTDSVSKQAILIANPVIYTVVTRNANLSDEWASFCLQGLQINDFTNAVFQQIYNNNVPAINYETDKVMSIEEVKKLEKEFPRKRIGKVQFEEDWYFDAENFKMSKRVKSVMFAYELYDLKGAIRGYKAGIKVLFESDPQNLAQENK